jgi:LuxR family glucitol operon transcriptional activator
MSSHTIVSQQRLTLFALISAIENDARILISTNLLPGKSVADVFPEQVVLEAKDRLKRAAHLIVDQNIDLALLNFMDIGDHFQTLQRWRAQLNDGTNKVISKSTKIETLVAVRNRVMHGRPLDFDDLPFLKNFAQEIAQADSFNWAGTRELLKALRRDPSYAFEFERDFEIENVDNILHNLPSPDFDDTGFVGRLGPVFS